MRQLNESYKAYFLEAETQTMLYIELIDWIVKNPGVLIEALTPYLIEENGKGIYTLTVLASV